MDISDLITSNQPVSNHEKEETRPKKRENPDQEKNWGTRYTLLFEQQQWIHKMHPIKGIADRTLVGVSKVCNSQNTMCRHMMEWLLVSIHVKQTLRLVHPSQFLIYWCMGTYGYLALHYVRKKGNHHFMNLVSLMQLCPFHMLGLSICGF